MKHQYDFDAATAESPFGPFEGSETVLSASDIADGPGHNSGFSFNGKTYIAYHRRIIGDTDKNHRMLCIDEMQIEGDTVKPIVMT